MMEREERSGLILHVQRLSTEDGPGIRSTVFFKACPLSCRWCHNPESISGRPEVQWFPTRCIGCRSCTAACPRGCIVSANGGLSIDRARCQGCGACAEECPTGALELLGRRVTVDGLVAELVKDRSYYESSGGGVTLSGGEPLAQPGFTAAVLHELKARGIQTAVDTCGFASAEAVESVLPDADLILFDLKGMDGDAHAAFTGQPNEPILRNLLRIAAARKAGAGRPRLWIRTPLIPGSTATGDVLRAIGAFIAGQLDGAVERWELCAFNNLCRDKYGRLGLPWAYDRNPLMAREELDAMAGHARASGVPPGIVSVTGAAREEKDA
jgi:pyruvate formate lyase activating enzyme